MIHVLCASCNTHLLDTDVNRLDWPMTGAMFSVVYPGWWLRPAMLDLNIFCPVCEQFPFRHNPYIAGSNAVDRYLNVRGEDGKPKLMSIKDILLSSREPAPLSQGEPQRCMGQPIGLDADDRPVDTGASPGEKPAKEFPCSTCGAKKRFHKKGCSLKNKITKSPEVILDPDVSSLPSGLREFERERRRREREGHPAAPLVDDLVTRVKGASFDKGDGPVTAAEIHEMEKDREIRHPSRQSPENLRPEQG